jgi:hypothetical protein
MADAAVYALYGGAQAGNGLADVLFGGVSPTARLPFTVFETLDQIKPMSNYDMTASPGRTHLYYTEADVTAYGAPQFWFGFGLSYTSFSYGSVQLGLVPGPQCSVTAAVTVSNSGKRAAHEVAQLYLSRPLPVPGVPMVCLCLPVPPAPGTRCADGLPLGSLYFGCARFRVDVLALNRVASAHLEGGMRAVQRHHLSLVRLPYNALRL